MDFNRLMTYDGQEYVIKGYLELDLPDVYIDVKGKTLLLHYVKATETTLLDHDCFLLVCIDDNNTVINIYIAKHEETVVIEDTKTSNFLILYKE